MGKNLWNMLQERRSFYAIGKDVIISDEKIFGLVRHALKHVPSSFNSQSARILVVLGKEHEKLWIFTKEILKEIVPAESFQATEAKINGFQNGYGTVLYFEDQKTVEGLQKQYPLYKEKFPIWALQSSGMLQHSIWMLLEEAGYGASLQHYDPLIDKKVKQEWRIPDEWTLMAQMPFGNPLQEPGKKTFYPLDERLRFFQ